MLNLLVSRTPPEGSVMQPAQSGLWKGCSSSTQNCWHAPTELPVAPIVCETVAAGEGLFPATGGYCSFAYSALACFRMGMSGSASFQSEESSCKRQLTAASRTRPLLPSEWECRSPHPSTLQRDPDTPFAPSPYHPSSHTHAPFPTLPATHTARAAELHGDPQSSGTPPLPPFPACSAKTPARANTSALPIRRTPAPPTPPDADPR